MRRGVETLAVAVTVAAAATALGAAAGARVQAPGDTGRRPSAPLTGATAEPLGAPLTRPAAGEDDAPDPVAPAAASAQQLFENANERYRSGDHAGAAALYERVLRLAPESVPARYNLGNAAARDDRPAEALRQYLGVLRRAPRDPAARHNAAVVAARLREAAGARAAGAIAEPPGPPLSWVSVSETVWILLASAYVVTTLVVLAVLRARVRRVASLLAALIFLAATAFGLAAARAGATAAEGLVLRPDARALAGPSPDQPQVLSLPAGAALDIGQRQAGWVFVSLPNGLSGWAVETDVAPVP